MNKILFFLSVSRSSCEFHCRNNRITSIFYLVARYYMNMLNTNKGKRIKYQSIKATYMYVCEQFKHVRTQYTCLFVIFSLISLKEKSI